MSKLADALKAHKIDARRILLTSKSLEALRPQDRAIKLLKTQAKGGSEAAKTKLGENKEVRSGRAVAAPTLNYALEGKPITGPSKTRILAAVNHILTTKKKPAVTLKDLF